MIVRLSSLNYYPFGMVTLGRSFAAGSGYRFGFNGKESDAETYGSGNVYDYGFRIYNPRLGKFLSVDPLTSQYAFYSPYQFAGNDPVNFIDVDGLEKPVRNPLPKPKPVVRPNVSQNKNPRLQQYEHSNSRYRNLNATSNRSLASAKITTNNYKIPPKINYIMPSPLLVYSMSSLTTSSNNNKTGNAVVTATETINEIQTYLNDMKQFSIKIHYIESPIQNPNGPINYTENYMELCFGTSACGMDLNELDKKIALAKENFIWNAWIRPRTAEEKAAIIKEAQDGFYTTGFGDIEKASADVQLYVKQIKLAEEKYGSVPASRIVMDTLFKLVDDNKIQPFQTNEFIVPTITNGSPQGQVNPY